MKRTLSLLIPVFFFGCVLSQKSLTETEKDRAVRIGDAAVMKLMRELKTNLGMALKEGGFPKAIDFCADKAQKLTQKVNRELVVVKVKRVSDRYRNPTDKPDTLDLKVINYFKEKLREGKLPPYYIVESEKNGERVVIYYKPIRVAPFCLNCHGDPARMNPEVLRVLKERYPNDKALGYRPGDLRGVFKVVIPEKELKEG